MMLLVTTPHPDVPRHPDVGRLLTPQLTSGVERTAAEGIPWAADCDAFGGFGPKRQERFEKMVVRIEGLDGCRWVTCPDVVGDHAATLESFARWAPELQLARLPIAFVLQDGVEPEEVPWAGIDAVFIGGSTEFKLGAMAATCAARARERGLWVHMGRVNSWRRMRYAAAIGCDSVDGTCFSRWRGTHLTNGLRWLAAVNAQPGLWEGTA